MKQKILVLFAITSAALSSFGSLMISESFEYSGSPYDVDGGLNSGNGLPATGTGTPAGNGTGLRGGEWGGSINAGSLSYGSLLTSGNSLTAGAGFGTRTSVYRNMGTTDPFLGYRVGGTTSDFVNFGNDGTTMWFSFLMKTSAVGDGIRSSIRIGEAFGQEFGIGINAQAASGFYADKFTIDPGSGGVVTGSNVSSVAAVADTTYLLVGSITFSAAGDETVNWYINPTIGGGLVDSPDISYTTSINQFTGFQTRVDGATVIIDELRVGESFEDVTPIAPPVPLASGADESIFLNPADVTYYVNGATGADTNPGTSGAPFKTVDKGMDMAIAARAAPQSVRLVIEPGFYELASSKLAEQGSAINDGEYLIIEGSDPFNPPVITGDRGTPGSSWNKVSNPDGYWTISRSALGTNFPPASIPWPEVTGGEPLQKAETLFVNARRLEEALTYDDLAPGKYYPDWTTSTIYLYPDADVIANEAGIRHTRIRDGFLFKNYYNIKLANLVFQRFATAVGDISGYSVTGFNPGQSIGFKTGANILLDNVTVKENSWGTATFNGNANITLRDCTFVGNGGPGLGIGGVNILMENLTITDNHWRGYLAGPATATGWAFGSPKIANSQLVTLRNLAVHDNLTYGIWFDFSCTDVTIENANVTGNKMGLYLEASVGPFYIKNSAFNFNTGPGVHLAGTGSVEFDTVDFIGNGIQISMRDDTRILPIANQGPFVFRDGVIESDNVTPSLELLEIFSGYIPPFAQNAEDPANKLRQPLFAPAADTIWTQFLSVAEFENMHFWHPAYPGENAFPNNDRTFGRTFTDFEAAVASAVNNTYGSGIQPASLMVYESFDYGGSPYDVDGGLNSGNGLPATNVGGDPAGTGTGLRGGEWGGSINSGSLSYGSLLTSGNSLQAASGFGSRTFVYRNMTTDPFLALRQGSTSANFGSDGTTLWFSFLMQTNAVGDGIRSSLRIGEANGTEFGIGINAVAVSGSTASTFTVEAGSGGVITGSNTSGVTAVANTTYLLVGSIEFTSGNETVNWYINPTIGGALVDAADISFTTTINSFNGFQTRVDGATVIFDEIRIGESFEDVTPVAVLNPIEEWRLLHFGSPDNSGDGADGFDFDLDGLVNLMEFALGGNPLVPDAGAANPTMSLDGNTVELSFFRASDFVTYTIEGTSKSTAWSWGTVSTDPGTSGGFVTAPDNQAVASGDGRFLRLDVTY